MADALTALIATADLGISNSVNSTIGLGAIAWGGSFTKPAKPVADSASSSANGNALKQLQPFIQDLGKANTVKSALELNYLETPLQPYEIKYIYTQAGLAADASKVYLDLTPNIAYDTKGKFVKDVQFINYGTIITTNGQIYYIFQGGGFYYVSNSRFWKTPVDLNPLLVADQLPSDNAVLKAYNLSAKPVVTAPTINVPSTKISVATKVEDFSNKFNPADAFYRIIYTDNQNNTKAFVFTFLPARETKMGNWNVPEARTGMPIQTKMRHKMQVIPGAGPIVQTIGVNGTTITVVGALLGNEIIAQNFVGAGPSAYPRYESGTFSDAETEGVYSAGLPRGAYDKVQELTNRLVYPGRPVTIEIKPSNTQATFQMGEGKNKIGDFIRMTGVVTAVRVQYAHSDRCYYALDLFVTSYPNQPVSLNPDINASALDTTPIAFATTTNQDGIDLNSLSELDSIETKGIPITPFAKVAANFLSGQPILSSVSQAIAAFDDQTISNVSTIAQSGNIYNAISNLSATGLSTTAQMETLAQLARLSNIDNTGIAAITAAITRGLG